MNGDTTGASLRITLIAIRQDLLLRAFDIKFLRKIRIVNQLLLAIRKWAYFSRSILFPRGQLRFKVVSSNSKT